MSLSYGSVCSGIEAASVAWEPLGWLPSWFSEVEPFPSAVLAYRWPHVTNLGDMTKIAALISRGEVEAPDVLVGGTPCQAFSVAGLRLGLSDARGQLTISFVGIANAIDERRGASGKQQSIIVWENVPGVLSSRDNAFGCFLGALSGEDGELQPPGGKWTHAGYVSGPQRAVAWRVLDAQYFGLAQRRRRVFVVASARADIDPAKVLFEFESGRRDTPPSRSAGATVAALTASGVGTCGADDNQGQAGRLIPMCATGDISHTLKAEGFDASEDSTGRGVPIVTSSTWPAVAASCLDAHYGDKGGLENQHVNAGCPLFVPEPFTMAIRGRAGGSSVEVRNDGVANALLTPNGGRAGMGVGAIAYGPQVRRLTPVECERLQGFPDGHTLIPFGNKIRPEKMARDYAKYLMRSGHLSFSDCCRAAADAPRYKAIGNSMAVFVMRWIGRRIDRALVGEGVR